MLALIPSQTATTQNPTHMSLPATLWLLSTEHAKRRSLHLQRQYIWLPNHSKFGRDAVFLKGGHCVRDLQRVRTPMGAA
jgi:hypothetical protein